jgi:hypothetical protein
VRKRPDLSGPDGGSRQTTVMVLGFGRSQKKPGFAVPILFRCLMNASVSRREMVQSRSAVDYIVIIVVIILTIRIRRMYCVSNNDLAFRGIREMAMRQCLSESNLVKKLLLMAALLAPGLAYGQNPSADLSVQVVPGSAPPAPPAPPANGIACDYGPNTTFPTGTVGTDLTTAGFTHCVLNADFTDNSGATVGGGWVMNNPATWLNECVPGGPTNTWGKFWLTWGGGNVTNNDQGHAPCDRLIRVQESDGTWVIEWQFGASDVTSNIIGMNLYWPLCGNNCTNYRPALPTAFYEEVTTEVESGLTQNGGHNQNVVYSFDENSIFDNSPSQASGFMDMSLAELYVNKGSDAGYTGITSMDNYTPGGKVTSGFTYLYDLGNYHTYADLSTTSGNNFSICYYVDASPISNILYSSIDGTYCGHYPSFQSNEIADHDRRFARLTNWDTTYFVNTITIRIKKIRIFTCSSYVGVGNDCTASQSGGSVVFH